MDTSARICHAPSTAALDATIGCAATTCSYSDWIGTDLLIFVGTNIANNQPVATKYLHYAKEAGTKVFVVNPYFEPGLDRYWVPSVAKSALFGTKFADDFFQIHPGGDIAFFNGVLKLLIENDWIDREFHHWRAPRDARKPKARCAAFPGKIWSAARASRAATCSASPRPSAKRGTPSSSGAWGSRSIATAATMSAPS